MEKLIKNIRLIKVLSEQLVQILITSSFHPTFFSDQSCQSSPVSSGLKVIVSYKKVIDNLRRLWHKRQQFTYSRITFKNDFSFIVLFFLSILKSN